MSSDVTFDEAEAPTGPQEIVPDEPTGPQYVVPAVQPGSRTLAGVLGALISALMTGGVAELLSYPATCDTTFGAVHDRLPQRGWAGRRSPTTRPAPR